jgi:chaperonin cofactor prefoldin
MMIIDARTDPPTLAEFEAIKAEFAGEVAKARYELELENYELQIETLQQRIADLEREIDAMLHIAASQAAALTAKLEALRKGPD